MLIVIFISVGVATILVGMCSDEDFFAVGCIFTIIEFILLILILSVNEKERIDYVETSEFSGLFNTTQVVGSGGLFYTTISEKDYLIYWTEEDDYKKRNKIGIDWDIVKVYEDDNETPRFEKKYSKRNMDTRKAFWFDFYPRIKVIEMNIYVPEGSVIQHIELK